MQWSKELEDLNIDIPQKKSSLKSSISYLQSFVKVSLDSNDQLHDTSQNKQSFNSNLLQSWASNDPKSPDDHNSSFISSPTSRKHSSKMSLDYDKIFRRFSSKSSDHDVNEISPILSNHNPGIIITQSSEKIESKTSPSYQNLLSPIFVSPVLCLVDLHPENNNNNNNLSNSPTNQVNNFSKGTIQFFSSGTLIVNYEKKIDQKNYQQLHHQSQKQSQTQSQTHSGNDSYKTDSNDENEQELDTLKCSKSYTCRKVLCYKFQSNIENKESSHSNSVDKIESNNKSEIDDINLISSIALQLRIYPIGSEIQGNRGGNSPMSSSRRATPPVKLLSKKLKNGNVYSFGEIYSEIVL